MNFINYYKSISDKEKKQTLRNKVIEVCKIQQATFYSWVIRGKITPLAQDKINELLKDLNISN